ncbi:Nif3-like dinuclear metal center hexameric protein [Faecalispora anaeroviscerum]|uniref:Nif3-like dinuclear metal center hexameric protein n=1 Tax=Faecalispora anaeroviscerum TaxID=2991836 RepID=UPI0024B87F22|nr:Nif3-like dinuclear metal center hexameric protein [Faecalispora anaeroviscerum]
MNMVTAGDIYDFFNVCAPFETAMSFDNAGFLVGDRQVPVSAVLLALDITPGVVEEAARLGAELIISHHPVIFQPLRHIKPQDVPYLLVQRGIAAICAHTNLDLAPGGVNTCLAEALTLEDIRGIKPYAKDGLWEGLVGNLSQSYSPAKFAEFVKQALFCGGLKYVDGGKPIQTVALCGGAGADLLEDAVQAGADAFVTADTKHHQLLLAKQLGITLVDAGHFNTEDVVILPLKNTLQEQFPTVHFQKSEALCDPAQYL